MFTINTPEKEKGKESQLDILLKINTGEYVLQKKKKRSSVWNVYREIVRGDGSRLKWRFYCMGCKRVMQSTGGTTSNLRIHKCHVRYLKQNGNISVDDAPSPGTDSESLPNRIDNERVPTRVQSTGTIRQLTYADQYEEFYEEKRASKRQYDEMGEELENHDEPDPIEEFLEPDIDLGLNSSDTRPLIKLFSEESCSAETEEQCPIVLENEVIQEDFKRETLQPKTNSTQIDPSALAEAESYARSWAHAFLKLSEDQKFYAKRSIDELLVLGRLERLNISTVTSLTTNL
ncbi:uncharacterized protein LOC111071195 [Drosophila obscura]|uniref:uncharacterized protein LOC111071195 n=1 Tax=Drosophila obscura TaxID=7282 RepID=UPI001BB2AB13|nr:uncharacterized protein LOC111071195 [Drosophila obscura]